ncbi:MAG TPA: amidohydrolase family protein [Verrucomicrobiae bacterium]|nr:amidohydrolase family protein [Verrucomicrobiae bacterium]
MDEKNAPPAADAPSSSSEAPIVLRSRILLPISGPPCDNGAVLISGNRIRKVGTWNEIARESRGDVMDLGDSILLPGLINAHCHLDYTGMAGLLPPQKRFTDWIKLMLAAKAEWNYTEFAESWLQGAQMLVRTGTTTVVDFEAVPELLPDVWSATPLRVHSVLEMTGVRSRRSPESILNEALQRADHLHDGRSCTGLAPHAPYSTAPELIRIAAEAARERHWLLSIHVSESVLEFDMFQHARGEMFDWLKRNERDMSDCGHGSPIRQLASLDALGPNLLAVHLNYIDAADPALLATHGAHVVHCPRSHFYFQHADFPIHDLQHAGVNVCLGTDSLATVYKRRHDSVELSMFDEMSCFAEKFSGVNPKDILRMATVNGARALQLQGQAGELIEGALADVIAIPYDGPIQQASEAAVNHRGGVMASMIEGQWAITPQGAPTRASYDTGSVS